MSYSKQAIGMNSFLYTTSRGKSKSAEITIQWDKLRRQFKYYSTRGSQNISRILWIKPTVSLGLITVPPRGGKSIVLRI